MGLWTSIRVFVLLACLLTAFLELARRKEENRAKVNEPKRKVSEKERIMAVDFTTPASTIKKPRKVVKPKTQKTKATGETASTSSRMTIFYSTLTGSSERYAKKLHNQFKHVMENEPDLLNLDYVDDMDEFFLSPKAPGAFYILVLPSYETECPLDYFIDSLKETYNDFRIDSRPLSSLAGFSVFGIGDSESWGQEDKFCYQAKLVDKYLGKLGARRVFPLGTGCIKTTIDESFDEYIEHLTSELRNPTPASELADIADSDDEGEDDPSVMDVEDMGKPMRVKESAEAKQMVAKDSPTYKALTKQGYTVVGSHSGVKICRWTKSALRGRGSCYKFAFYGIKSHLCMETTPSLSCSNKCVFCWRHGTNPVGTTWRWQVDPPKAILDGALEGHYKKIKMMKGVPGVQAARFAEAFTVRHCALSLVGEPIFYPHINEFLEMLHAKHISSFLVCNAQHPTELAALKRVTQLYVSIDSSDKESLRKVDRPLYRDFWERLEACLDIIREKRTHRTVYRLTLVKNFNAEDVEGYADLIARGEPCFVEVKGMTYCGTSKNSVLSMENVPYYEEVQAFVEALETELQSRGLEYGLATEHAHSCCVLLAQKRFYINEKWYTHIDYAKFFELLESGADFGPMDYIAETPSWAYYGSEEAGFNPVDVKHRRGKPVE